MQPIDPSYVTRIAPQSPRLLDRVRAAVRRLNYSPRTGEAYVHWIRRYILYHDKRHPVDLGEREVTAFLNHLANDRDVAAATQNQDLAALLFLYKHVLNKGGRGVQSPLDRTA